MYDGLPIITNKVTTEEQQSIPHHLLGFIPLDEEPWRVGMFKRKAGQIIKEIQSRGRLPVLVGGTHYYTQSLLIRETLLSEEEHANVESANEETSERFPILDGPTEHMLEKLREVDPVMADRWHPKDRRKIRRSLEIFLVTGKRASDAYAEQRERKSQHQRTASVVEATNEFREDTQSLLIFWVHAKSDILKKRLDTRIDTMLENGLLEEARSMEKYLETQTNGGIDVDRTRGIWVSIGWKEFEPYLKALKSGTASATEVQHLYELSVEQTKAATRQYAKRQIRWIRLQLLPALTANGILDKLYLLDGSDVTQFAESVSKPAIDIMGKFLDAGELTPPTEVCNAAAEMLVAKEAEAFDVNFRQECELCQSIAVTDVQWQTHLKSRRHRALVKKKRKNEASGRSSHQKDDSALDTP